MSVGVIMLALHAHTHTYVIVHEWAAPTSALLVTLPLKDGLRERERVKIVASHSHPKCSTEGEDQGAGHSGSWKARAHKQECE